MKLKNRYILLVASIMVFLSSCNVVPSIMMKTDKGYEFDKIPTDSASGYIISSNDIIDFKLYTNDGTKLIDLTALSLNEGRVNGANSLSNFLVESDGMCKLPIIGRVELKGKKIKEAEDFLQEQYAVYYKKPFVQLKVLNRRVTIFSGIGKGVVINLENENTTIIEAIGKVGGLPKDSKAHKIKVVRGDLKDPQVYLFDFSTIEGVKNAGFVLQANDIVYIEPQKNTVLEVVRDLAPIVSLITSTITLIVLVNRLD
jgi:polysaccharide export outer membrane protein